MRSLTMAAAGSQRSEARTEELRGSEQIQGNILAPFNKPVQLFLFVNFNNDQDGARQWLTVLTDDDRIATTKAVVEHTAEYRAWKAKGGAQHLRQTWMGIGLTSSGLVTLHPELAADLVEYEAFWQGAVGDRTDELGYPTTTPTLLGDKGASDPRNWVIGGPYQSPVDALVTIASDTENALGRRAEAELRLARELGLTVLEVRQRDGRRSQGQRGNALRLRHAYGGTEHFGFKYGVSQPGVEGFTAAMLRHGRLEAAEQPGSPIVATGEFVLGYRWERGSYRRDRPRDPTWMWDGSFQVFRRLTQDVAGWRAQMHRLSTQASLDIAAKAIGRQPNGTPLAPAGGPGLNDFTYADDPEGVHTPRFAHIRKMNPRDDAELHARTHRMLRRGIPFGPPLPDQGEEDGVERGLLFNAFMASIEDQFEFVQRNRARNPLYPSRQLDRDGPDPVTAAGDGPCVLQREYAEPLELHFERFVHTTGAVYAFAPSIAALRRLGAAAPLKNE
jgi:Dyp-type peroxidase family